MKDKKNTIIVSITALLIVFIATLLLSNDEELKSEVTEETIDTISNITTYEMTEENIAELPSTEIVEQTEEDENAQEQEVESEAFEEQGEIAYNGSDEYPTVSLGNYTGLTYYSQLDSRWSSHLYTSCGNSSQTVGTSGCAPTTASMIVTAIKGTITPPEMSDLFVQYGYRSSNNGTYLSAFRFVADTFDLEYQEAENFNQAIELLRNNNYVAVSCGNGLFTTGGHLILLYGIDGDTIKIYDPYLYSGKFETSTRRGKATVDGNTVYVTVDNFKKYANATHFYAYKHDGNTPTNNTTPVVTSTYTRYVKANGGLNVRNSANGSKVGAIANGTKVTVYSTNGNWSEIGTNRWVNSSYLVSSISTTSTSIKKYSTGTYKVNTNINVRSGAGTKYSRKTYKQLSTNARSQNRKLGGEYNGYRKGVVCTVTKVNGNWRIFKKWVALFRLL